MIRLAVLVKVNSYFKVDDAAAAAADDDDDDDGWMSFPKKENPTL